MRVDEPRVVLAILAFALQVISDRGAETPVDDPVRGPGRGRRESPGDLVLSLRAGLEACDAVLDAIVDALVVAGLEVKAVMLPVRAPVATIQRVATPEEHGHGQGLVTLAR